MKNPFKQYKRWLKEVKQRNSQPPINPQTWRADSEGFGYDEKWFSWQDISKITIYLVDFFAYDRVEVSLSIGSKVHAITEGDNGFPELIYQLKVVFPCIDEPIQHLSTHAFSTQVFEIVPTKNHNFPSPLV